MLVASGEHVAFKRAETMNWMSQQERREEGKNPDARE